MTNRKLILYIAMSLDGFIAGENDDLSWLSLVERPDEDYGYNDFIKTVDTVIMGRKTYEKVLTFGIEFLHKGRKCYVLSRKKTGADDNVTFYNGDLRELIESIRQEEGLNIFCDGGAEVVHELMNLQLIDRFIISVIPVCIGAGVPLFKGGRPVQNLELKRSSTFPSGLVQLWYDRK